MENADDDNDLDRLLNAPSIYGSASTAVAVRGKVTRLHRDPLKSAEQPQLTIKSSGQFVAEFTPPDYTVDGLLQEGFLYSLTGATGAGKTAITLPLAASVALGQRFAGRETKKKRVLYLAAENRDDVRMRWIALSQRMDFDRPCPTHGQYKALGAL